MVRSRKADAVLESARALFLERGYSGTTIDDIAARARISKATVYSNFHDKEALLTALVEQISGEAAGILAETLRPLEEDGPLRDRLERVATALADGVLRPQVVQLRRLAIAEAARSPLAGRTYWTLAPDATLSLLAAAFERLRTAGELRVADARSAAEQFAYALLGPLQDRALLAPDLLPAAADRAVHIRSVVSRLLATAGAEEDHPAQ